MTSPIGRRIHVIGSTNAGKSTVGARLARLLAVPHVEMDALNWQPGWVSLVEVDPEGLRARLTAATAGDGWVVDGDYSRFTRPVLWPRLDTVVWLDLPRALILRRVLVRSWRRWRSQELLWGTNRESFWGQLAVWRREDSLLWWAWTRHEPKRRQALAHMADPQWAHIRFVRLNSPQEIAAFLGHIEDALGGTPPPSL